MMPNFMQCREVVGTGKRDGKLLGYVIQRERMPLTQQWYAYRLDAANDLVYQGCYETADLAAVAVVGE